MSSRLVVRTTPGAGKTQCVVQIAQERAARGLRTAILTPTNKLADQIVREIRKDGTLCGQEGSPLAVLDDLGVPVCIHLGVGQGLAHGRYLMRKDLCRVGAKNGQGGCSEIAQCSAMSRTRSSKAQILVAPHQHAESTVEFLENDGLLVIDETPVLVDVKSLNQEKLKHALANASTFRNSHQVRYLLSAVLEGLGHAPQDLQSAFKMGAATLDSAETSARRMNGRPDFGGPFQVNAIRSRSWMASLREKQPHFVPDLVETVVSKLRDAGDATTSERIGSSAETIGAIIETLMNNGHSALDQGVLSVANVPSHTRAMLLYPGHVVILDATHDPEELAGVAAKIGAEGFDTQEQAIEDGSEIRRIIIARAHMSRKYVIDSLGKPIWVNEKGVGLLSSVRAVIDIAIGTAGALSLALVSIKRVADDIQEHWEGLGDCRELRDVLKRWRDHGGTLEIGHYFSLRGLDSMKHCDVLATLVDPWLNMGSFKLRCEVLGLKEHFNLQYLKACEAELEQAHGRFRIPWRRKPGLLIHCGRQIPESWGREVEVSRIPPGRTRAERNPETASLLRLWRAERGLSIRKAATMLGVSKSTLGRYEDGKQGVPSALLEKIEGDGASQKPLIHTMRDAVFGFHISGTSKHKKLPSRPDPSRSSVKASSDSPLATGGSPARAEMDASID